MLYWRKTTFVLPTRPSSILAMLLLFLAIFHDTWLVTLVTCRPMPLKSDYLSQRSELIQLDNSSSITLTPDEKIVSDYLVKEKMKLIEASQRHGELYMPAQSFYESKSWMEKQDIFKLIKKMPKGAALHLHGSSLTSLDWVVGTFTYRENVCMCVDKRRFMVLLLAFNEGGMNMNHSDHRCEWMSVQEEREKADNEEEFDESIRRNLSLLTTDPMTAFKDTHGAWNRFTTYFEQTHGLIMSSLGYGDYFGQALKEFHDDNVQYMEVRADLLGVFDPDMKHHSAEYALKILNKVTHDFVKKHPDFAGAKFILTGKRHQTKQAILREVKEAIALHRKYPDTFLGYDLVEREDRNQPLFHFIDELLYPSQQNPPYKLPYFFHAADTNWQNTAVDYNLVDALLLNATRIGDGYGLPKHPALVKEAWTDGVVVEVNPISNQILRQVSDLRNHAMILLMTQGFPVVISSDYPASWEAAPLSHDFYLAFMTMCGADVGLEFLKQLANNSIQYSAMNEKEKVKVFRIWQRKWNQFINETVESLGMEEKITLKGIDL